MPLPSALISRLSKRGIISAKNSDGKKKVTFKGFSTCPNKNNVYHECTYWCETHWKGINTQDPTYTRNMQKLLFKYPLPPSWTEVYDKGLGRFYYWHMETDLVSWLPPRHPKSIKTISAAKLRERMARGRDVEGKKPSDGVEDGKKSDSEDERPHHSSSRHKEKSREHREERRHRRDDRYSRRYRDSRKREENNLDPMDPAAYSDIPQGSWTDGLENKSRADSTASGALFQQRPYPAPGEVLASNKEKAKIKSKS